MKTILFDASLCNGCYGCQMACKDEHCGNDWSPIAAEQPTTGQFWCKVEQTTRGKIPEIKVQYQPVLCGHCENAACMEAATDNAVYRRDDGLVIIDPVKAKGQKAIADACPAGAVYYNEALDLPQKCTGCAHLLDDGWTTPRCVDVCATGALAYIDEEDVPEAAYPMPAAGELHPHVYYMNIPKRWVYGVLVDRTINEVIVGATVQLVDAEGAEVASVETDEFGEFRFKELDEAAYTVHAKVDGYEDVVLAADTTEEDVVLGDIFLNAAA
ncbi:4Fe-4S dicluster domain-containing protein [Raoultibacter phocaeensis]|uniref:4Fe-4S dicluster domain-containing protein n=1 Tax=Raoultibacter phocaeensis TaxID=2479841 RepID=UPI001118E548|nr:4Fe-4S dicluster domain-containing protein [Raoultibacter phocaeensis]